MECLEIPRVLFTREPYKSLSLPAKMLFITLKNHAYMRYSNDEPVTRTNAELAADMGISLATLKRAKAELLTTNLVKCEVVRGVCVYSCFKGG